MKPRDKTHRLKDGELVLFSSPESTDWGGRFGMQVRKLRHPYLGVLLTPTQARKLAADLLRRADYIEGR